MGGRARVRLEKTEQRRIFPVSWAWYEKNPVAMVEITNQEPNTITDINLSFFIDSYMSQPWNFAALPRLAPNRKTIIHRSVCIRNFIARRQVIAVSNADKAVSCSFPPEEDNILRFFFKR